MDEAALAALAEKYRSRFAPPYSLVKAGQLCGEAGHPFTVGTRHVVAASDRHGGVLSEAVCRSIPCARKGCTWDYDAHKMTLALFIGVPGQLGAAVPDDLADMLRAVRDEAAADGIDGFAFLEGR